MNSYNSAKYCFRDKFNELRQNVRTAYSVIINKHEEIHRALDRIQRIYLKTRRIVTQIREMSVIITIGLHWKKLKHRE